MEVRKFQEQPRQFVAAQYLSGDITSGNLIEVLAEYGAEIYAGPNGSAVIMRHSQLVGKVQPGDYIIVDNGNVSTSEREKFESNFVEVGNV